MTENMNPLGTLQQELASANADFNGDGSQPTALAYYNGTEKAADDEGYRLQNGQFARSVVNSGVVYDQVNAALDQMWPTLKSPLICEFEAMSEDDEGSAQNETIAVHQMIMKQNKGAIALASAAWDAMVLRYGVVRVWIDDRLETVIDEYPSIGQMALAQLTEQAEQSVDSDDALEILDVQPAGEIPVQDPETGEAIGMEPAYSVETKRWVRKPKLNVKAWPAENFRVKYGTGSTETDDIEFCALLWPMSRQTAKDRGFDPEIVDRIPADNEDTASQTAQARNRGTKGTKNWSTDKDMETIIICECYWRYDLDDDGQAELNKVYVGGRDAAVWISNERAGCIPVAVGVTRLYPHRFEGDSFFDSHKHIHDSKRGALRAWNNSLAANLQGGKIVNVSSLEDPADVYSKEIERVIRVNGDVSSVMASEPWNDITPAVIPALDYWDKLSANRGGGGVDLISEAVPVGNNTAHGTERRESSKELPMERSLGTFMETCAVSLWKIVHTMLRTDYRQPVSVRKPSGVWITEDPNRWQPREGVNIVSGLTLGERLRRSAALTQEINTQIQLKAEESLLVDDNGLHTALIARAYANGLVGADSWWVDPQSPQGQEAQQKQSQQQEQMQQMQQKIQQMQEQMQATQMQATTALAEAELAKAQAAVAKQENSQLQMLVDAASESVDQTQKERELDIKDRDSMVDAAVKVGELGLDAAKVTQTAERLGG